MGDPLVPPPSAPGRGGASVAPTPIVRIRNPRRGEGRHAARKTRLSRCIQGAPRGRAPGRGAVTPRPLRRKTQSSIIIVLITNNNCGPCLAPPSREASRRPPLVTATLGPGRLCSRHKDGETEAHLAGARGAEPERAGSPLIPGEPSWWSHLKMEGKELVLGGPALPPTSLCSAPTKTSGGVLGKGGTG